MLIVDHVDFGYVCVAVLGAVGHLSNRPQLKLVTSSFLILQQRILCLCDNAQHQNWTEILELMNSWVLLYS